MGLLETAAQQRADDTALIENKRAVIGDNRAPPDVIETAREVYKKVAAFLNDHPAIVTEDDARAANDMLGSGRSMLKSLDLADGAECDPIYARWKELKAKWKKPITSLKAIVDQLAEVLRVHMVEEDRKRKAIAEEARLKAAEAERIAREAEAAEQLAIKNAAEGEFSGVGEAMANADQAFDQFKEAKAEEKVAVRDEDIRYRSRFAAKATTLRTVETLHVDDPVAALNAMWPDAGIESALLTAARAWRKAHGGETLPPGIRRTTEQKI